jgi:hypothetical protein
LEVAVGTGRLFSQIVARNPRGSNEGIDLLLGYYTNGKINTIGLF